FERKRFWIEPRKERAEKVNRPQLSGKKSDIAEWIHTPAWIQTQAHAHDENSPLADKRMRWVIMTDELGIGQSLAERLRAPDRDVFTVSVGDRFEQVGEHAFKMNPQNAGDYLYLLDQAVKVGNNPTTVIHLWLVTPEVKAGVEFSAFCQKLGF